LKKTYGPSKMIKYKTSGPEIWVSKLIKTRLLIEMTDDIASLGDEDKEDEEA